MDNSNSTNWLQSAGEMGKLVADKDWSKTPLGPIESWPQSLRTTVSLCLSSNFPIAIAWGAERTQIYNDGYWPICGAKHPHSMGQDFKECWFSAWPVIGAAFESAAAGQTAFLTNQRMFLDRNGYLEETFFTFSFSPIHDETGNVGGLFHPVTELTQQSLIERRLQVLRDIAYQPENVRSVADTLHLLLQTLSRHPLDVPFMLCYQLDEISGETQLVGHIGANQEPEAAQAFASLTSPTSWPLAEAAQTGQNLELNDLMDRIGPFSCDPYPEPLKSAVILPLAAIGPASHRYLLVAGVSARRPLDEGYRNFHTMLGSAVFSLLVKAQADEDERRRIEALAELDRAKIAFFSNVSHEFRTPITLMLGPLEDLLAEHSPASASLPVSAYEQLDVVHRNGLRLLKLVNTLLDFASIEANRMEAVYEATDIGQFTADLASLFRSAIEKAGLKLIISTPTQPELIYVDRRMWEKIVINLLSNALKFTFSGEIEVAVRDCDMHVELAVRDTGVGIAEDQQDKVFERFHRIHNTRSRTHEGTGIGLALVQELARLQGGSVSLQSQIGIGSTFTVTLPRGTGHLQAENIRESQESSSSAARLFINEVESWVSGAGGNPLPGTESSDTSPPSADRAALARIVLADDNLDMLDYVSRILQKQGYQVTAVRDGEAALAAIHEQCPDLVLTDIMMPRLDGLGLVAALRNSPKTQALPIILLSARAGEEARADGLQSGADDYLVKPFSARELLTSVKSRLEIARLRQATEAEALQHELGREFQAFAESMPQLVWATRPDGWNIYFNQKWVEYTGLSFEESYGHGWVTPFHPDDQPRAWQAWQRATEQLDTYALECRLRRFDGVYRWWLIRGVPLLNENGEIYKWIGTCTDIQDLKENEENLRVSEARWQFALDGSDQGVWDWDIQNGSVFFSKRWKSMLGYAEEEISNRFEEWSSRLEPDDLNAAMAAVDHHFRGETAYYQHEFRMRNRQNEMIWILSRGMVISRDEEGRPLRMIGTQMDVSAQHRMMADLQLWANAFKHCAHGIVISNPVTNRIIFCNPAFARLRGYNSPDEFAGLPLLDLYPPDRQEQITKFVRIADEKGQVSFESRQLTRLGTDFAIQVDIVSVKDGDSILYRVGTTQDISVRKQNEAELSRYRDQLEELVENRTRQLFAARQEAERLSQVKGTFIANMSHEIRTPMIAVLGFCYLLEKRALDDETHQLVRKIKSAGETLLTIINDILDFSKIEAGHLTIEQEPFDLLDMLDSLADLTRPSLTGKNLELIINPPQPEFTRLIGDTTRLQQVLLNLLSNAIKFTQEGEVELRISVETKHATTARLRFSVRDTGIGISETTQHEIFSAFTQADPSITRRFGGTGLGLAISRQLVNLMGGTLQINSKVGFGSEFWFSLPMTLDNQIRNSHPPVLRDLNVLVVDDSEQAREALVNCAKCLGWTADSIDSGIGARLQIESAWKARRHYDVVMLDWKMPGLDGFATARAIRTTLQAMGCQPLEMPVFVIVTTYSRDELLSDPGMKFVDSVLSKPITASALYDVVAKHLSERERVPIAKPDSPALPGLKRIVGLRVLVVDDSEINREVAKAILEAEGAQVYQANDGQEALDWLALNGHDVDVILMDVQMPRLDGYAATKLIRQQPRWQRLPIITLTAGAFSELEDAAREAGMDGFVAKPFNVEQLLNVIRRFTDYGAGKSLAAASLSDNSTTSTPSVVLIEDTLTLPGISFSDGLHLWKERNTYQKYLGKFAETYANAGQSIVDNLKNGDLAATAALAHKLAGAASALGLNRVASQAREVNDLLAGGATSVAEASAELQAALVEACGSIALLTRLNAGPTDPEPQNTVIKDKVEATRLIHELLVALEQQDLELAETQLQALAANLSAPEIEQLPSLLDNFDFNAALAVSKALFTKISSA